MRRDHAIPIGVSAVWGFWLYGWAGALLSVSTCVLTILALAHFKKPKDEK